MKIKIVNVANFAISSGIIECITKNRIESKIGHDERQFCHFSSHLFKAEHFCHYDDAFGNEEKKNDTSNRESLKNRNWNEKPVKFIYIC